MNTCLLLLSNFCVSFIQHDGWLAVPYLNQVTNLTMLLVLLGQKWTGRFWHESMVVLHYFIQAMMPMGLLKPLVPFSFKTSKSSASQSIHLNDEAPKPDYVLGLVDTTLTTFQVFAGFAETVMVV